jgi:hypothetical protein
MFNIHIAISTKLKKIKVYGTNQRNGGLRHDGQHCRTGAWSQGRQRPVLALLGHRGVRPGQDWSAASRNEGPRPIMVGRLPWGRIPGQRDAEYVQRRCRRVPSAPAVVEGGAWEEPVTVVVAAQSVT